VIEIREYLDRDGRSPFSEWLDALRSPAAEKVVVALYRLAAGNVSNVKGVGSGVLEYRIHFGPGHRIYFGWDGKDIVVLLAGGTKHRQEHDIRQAIGRWAEYKQRKEAKPWR
jgi:putative addiction module killer protein